MTRAGTASKSSRGRTPRLDKVRETAGMQGYGVSARPDIELVSG